MKSRLLQICLISLLLLLLAGCSEQATPTSEAEPLPTQIVPTPINDPEQVAALMDYGAETEAAVAPDAPEPTEAPTEAPQADYCVECHLDKDMLIDTAKPEQEVISENEGAG